jgi:hypothetical protein
MAVPFDRFFAVFKWMLPIYGALHFIPAMLFKRKEFWEDPAYMAMKSLWGTTRSSAFLGVFVVIYQGRFGMGFSALRIRLLTISTNLRCILLQALSVRVPHPVKYLFATDQAATASH